MHIANISVILSIIAGLKRNRDNLSLKKYTGIFQELAFVSQFTIVSIYWPLLHIESLKVVEEFMKTD